jgi:hypothetical protein
VGLINQIMETLTEYCQGPCYENQAGFYTSLGNVQSENPAVPGSIFSPPLHFRKQQHRKLFSKRTVEIADFYNPFT